MQLSAQRALVAISFAFVVLICTGCSGEFGSTVDGSVTFDGKPLTSGTVTFHPVSGGAVAYGRIGPTGYYDIQTGTSAGLAPGEYRVTVVTIEVEPALNALDAPSGRRITPERYQNLDTTDLRAAIAPGSNTIDLQLTSPS